MATDAPCDGCFRLRAVLAAARRECDTRKARLHAIEGQLRRHGIDPVPARLTSDLPPFPPIVGGACCQDGRDLLQRIELANCEAHAYALAIERVGKQLAAALGTTTRALGVNPRALGTNPKAVRRAA